MILISFYTSANILAIINVLVLCAFLIFRKNNSTPNYVLALIFIIPGLYFIDNLLIVNGWLNKIPYFFFTVQIIANLFPVAVYYYVHLLLTDKIIFHKYLSVGSFLLLFFSITLTVYFALQDESFKQSFITKLLSDDYPLLMTLYNIAFYVWQMVYLIVVNKEIKAYKIKISNVLSHTEKLKVRFVKQFMQLLAILNLGLVLFYMLLPMPIVDYGILPVIVTVIYLFIIYYTIKNNAVFNTQSYQELVTENIPINVIETEPKTIVKSSDSSLYKNEKHELIAKKIEAVLYDYKSYRNPEFKLSNLAEQINEQPYVTSYTLNQHFNKSFFDIVNELRVRDAEERLKTFDPKKDKIEAIAYEVGFNSRAAFYRSFKKITGKNPTDFVSLS